MQKDYWDISKRNFRALGIVTIILAMFFESASSSAPVMFRTGLLIMVAFYLITTAMFFFIANLFKKRSANAIIVSYVYLGIAGAYFIVINFILDSVSNGLLGKVLGVLILIYLFINVRNASKQPN